MMLKRAGVTTITTGLLFSLLMPFFCLPPLSRGHWFQVEMPVVLLYFCASVVLMGSLCISRTYPHLFKRAFTHPMTLIFFGISLFTACFTYLRPIPMLNLFGNAEFGQGVFSLLGIAALLGGSLIIKHCRLSKRLLTIAAIIVTCLVAFLTCFGPRWNLPSPYKFEDYLAFYGIFLLPIMIIGLSWHRKRSLSFLALFCSLAIVLLSDNKSAIVLAIGLLGLVSCLFLLWRRQPKPFTRACIVLACLIPIVITGTIAYFGRNSLTEYDITGKSRILLTLQSRGGLTQLPIKIMSLNGWQPWLIGFGWGSNDDELVRAIHPSWTYMGSTHDRVFEFLHARQPFHWHNEYLQMLFSGGILCLALYMLLPLIILWSTPTSLGLVAAFTGLFYASLSTTWFQMPISLPLMAMGFAWLVGRQKMRMTPVLPLTTLQVVLVLGAGSLCYASYDAFWVASHFDKLKPIPSLSSAKENKENCGSHYVRFNRGGQAVIHTYGGYYDEVMRLEPTLLETAGPEGTRQWLQCVLHKQLAHPHTQLHVYTNLLALYTRLSTPALLHLTEEVPNFEENFQFAFERIHTLAPGRTDLAIPLLNYWLATEQKIKAIALANQLYQSNPHDAVALWYTGTFLISEKGEVQKGMRRLNLALDHGISKLLELDDSTMTAIRQF